MEIIDAQVHLNHLGFDACVAAMDAVGIDAAIIDQYPTDFVRLPNGAHRCRYGSAEDAARRLPHRFAYVARLDPADPDLPQLMAELRSHPGCLGIRVDQPARLDGFAELFALAERHDVPTWITLPGRLDEFFPCAVRLPGISFVIDHAGMPENWNRVQAGRFAPFEALLRLARLPNVAVKWGHATKLSAMPFPYQDVQAQLRRVVDAFGPQRVMWESDWTQHAGHETLAEIFFAIRLSDKFSEDEKAWLLGRTARTVMRWDRADDRLDVVVVAEADWPAFAEARAAQGRLPNGQVRVIRGEYVVPPGIRALSTAQVTAGQAAEAVVSGRIPAAE